MSVSCHQILYLHKSLPILRCLVHNENFLRIQDQNFSFKRCFRGRPSHNIGRIFGLEKKKPERLTLRQQGVWNENLHKSSTANTHDSLNFLVEGYDMVLVENFAQFIHRLMLKRDQKVVEVYALPSNDMEIRKMLAAKQQQVSEMSIDITLTLHKRVIQVVEIPSHQLPTILQVIMSTIPQSVKFSLKKHDEAQHFLRFQQKMELQKEKELLQNLYDMK